MEMRRTTMTRRTRPEGRPPTSKKARPIQPRSEQTWTRQGRTRIKKTPGVDHKASLLNVDTMCWILFLYFNLIRLLLFCEMCMLIDKNCVLRDIFNNYFSSGQTWTISGCESINKSPEVDHGALCFNIDLLCYSCFCFCLGFFFGVSFW
ncbi:hypothetical protein EGW08_003176, partial [Elysia chlorotica]